MAVVVVMAVAIPIAVSAASQRFADVPPSDWAYNDIQWLAEKGLTGGCGDGTNFCPDETVTRRESAVFTHRNQQALGPRLAVGYADNILVGADVPVRLTTAYLTVPTSGGAVETTATVLFDNNNTKQVGLLWIEANNGGKCATDTDLASIASYTTELGVFTSVGVIGSFPAGVGEQRFDLCAWGLAGSSIADEVQIHATWIASGATGGNFVPFESGSGNLAEITERIRQNVGG